MREERAMRALRFAPAVGDRATRLCDVASLRFGTVAIYPGQRQEAGF
jgi:hypothetical protein